MKGPFDYLIQKWTCFNCGYEGNHLDDYRDGLCIPCHESFEDKKLWREKISLQIDKAMMEATMLCKLDETDDKETIEKNGWKVYDTLNGIKKLFAKEPET